MDIMAPSYPFSPYVWEWGDFPIVWIHNYDEGSLQESNYRSTYKWQTRVDAFLYNQTRNTKIIAMLHRGNRGYGVH